jgi:hypothetical protein
LKAIHNDQDDEFARIMREKVGIEVQQKSMYYNYIGARTPRKGDNSYEINLEDVYSG